MRKEKNGLLIHIITLKVHTFFLNMLSGKICLQYKILGFANGTTVNTKNDESMEPMSDSFFHVHISLAFVITNMLPQMTEVTWCQNPTHPTWQPHCSNLDESASKYSRYSTDFPSTFWPSEEASWWSYVPRCCRSPGSYLTMFSFTKPSILYCRHKFPVDTLLQMHEPSGQTRERLDYCSLVSWELLFWKSKLLNKQIFKM